MRRETVVAWLERWGWGATVDDWVERTTITVWYVKIRPSKDGDPKKLAKAIREGWRGYLAQWKRSRKPLLQD
jgi:hypothetical protein